MDAVGRPTDCFAVAPLTVLRHGGDRHSGDAAAWSVPLRAPWALPTTERMDPTCHSFSNFQKTLHPENHPTKTHVSYVFYRVEWRQAVQRATCARAEQAREPVANNWRRHSNNRENGCRSRTQVHTPKQNFKVHNAGKFKTMATGKRHAPNRPPCSKLAESCGGSVDSELRQVSFYVTVGAIVHA